MLTFTQYFLILVCGTIAVWSVLSVYMYRSQTKGSRFKKFSQANTVGALAGSVFVGFMAIIQDGVLGRNCFDLCGVETSIAFILMAALTILFGIMWLVSRFAKL